MTYAHACCNVRASVDSLEQARLAIEAGADGIGLYRLEAMLFAPDRLPLVRAILGSSDNERRTAALKKLLPPLQREFEKLFQIVGPLPVTIRLLDPPLQSLFPDAQQLASELASAQSEENWEEYVTLERLRQEAVSLIQENPSMGHRGCRLCLTDPAFLQLQVRAILQAAVTVGVKGIDVQPEIMVPLVASEEEFLGVLSLIRQTASETVAQSGRVSRYKAGALIEVPRAALCAGAIAEHAEFISFGTNDLTQMTFGFSRDDAKWYMGTYLKQGIFKQDPFVSIDRDGVGWLIETAIEEIRQVDAKAIIGICGDHASDAESLGFFQSLNISFVSCSSDSVGKTRQMLEEAEELLLPVELETI